MAHDHVFLKAAETINFAKRCCFGKHTGRVLEGRRRDKAVGLERSLSDTEQNWRSFGRFPALLDHATVFGFEIKPIDLVTPEQGGIARICDFHLAQHLAHDDLDMFVVNLDALQPINFLHLIDQMFL